MDENVTKVLDRMLSVMMKQYELIKMLELRIELLEDKEKLRTLKETPIG